MANISRLESGGKDPLVVHKPHTRANYPMVLGARDLLFVARAHMVGSGNTSGAVMVERMMGRVDKVLERLYGTSPITGGVQ